jgi:Predicted membrane protein
MCGVSFPMEVEARPGHNTAAAHVVMKGEPLERTVRCLTGGDVELTGSADLKAELRVEGRRPHLVRNLTGTVEAEVRDGRVKKFALLGNVLAFRGVASLEDMKQDGFPYRRMSAKGRFADGQFRLDEGFFDSNAARLAASGRVDLLGSDSRITVLLAPLASVERVVGAIPLLGDVFGGTMVALPVEVIGDIRNPYVVPLGPRAISDQLLGIFERTLKLPGKLSVPEQPKP